MGGVFGVSGAVLVVGAGSYGHLYQVQGMVGSVLGCLCQVTAGSVPGMLVQGTPGLRRGICAGCSQGWFGVNGVCAGLGTKWELAGSVWGQSLPGAHFRGHCSLQAGSLWDTAASAGQWHRCPRMSEASRCLQRRSPHPTARAPSSPSSCHDRRLGPSPEQRLPLAPSRLGG